MIFDMYTKCFLYFKVGGEFFETVLSQMNTDGRVSVCGCISQYNATETPKGGSYGVSTCVLI